MVLDNVPWFKQPNGHTCTPACLKMLLEYEDIKISIAEIGACVNTTINGTVLIPENLLRLSSVIQRQVIYVENAPGIREIRKLLKKQGPLMVNISCYHDKHTIVLVGITKKRIIYLDPTKTPAPRAMSIPTFKKRWEKGYYIIIYVAKN